MNITLDVSIENFNFIVHLVNYSNEMLMRSGHVGDTLSPARDSSPNAGGSAFLDNTANVKGKLSNQNEILRQLIENLGVHKKEV